MLISPLNIDFNSEIILPLSKSESNRALMIMHYFRVQEFKTQRSKDNGTCVDDSATLRLCDFESYISNSDDTILLRKLLSFVFSHFADNEVVELNCANAGTVLRFLMTAVGMIKGSFVLTGCERMKQRPIKPLVDALRTLGASIEYLENESYPPVLIKGCEIVGGELEISVNQSSQFVSSLLLAAPLWKHGLSLSLTGNLVSLPYIDMTVDMMKTAGINVVRDGRKITVKHSKYNLDNLVIEPDWSAAAFWYEILVMSEKTKILLKNLNINSLQADAAAIKMFECLGIGTNQVKDGVVIKKVDSQKSTVGSNSSFFIFNFQDCPDLFPAVIAACAGMKIDAEFSGLKNLSIKESDRKKAMMNELMKINISFDEISDDVLRMKCPDLLPYFTEDNPIVFNNYEDHRIAMSLVPLAMKIGYIEMQNTEVVSKSYPDFFKDYKIC